MPIFVTSKSLLSVSEVRFWGQYKRIVGVTARNIYD